MPVLSILPCLIRSPSVAFTYIHFSVASLHFCTWIPKLHPFCAFVATVIIAVIFVALVACVFLYVFTLPSSTLFSSSAYTEVLGLV